MPNYCECDLRIDGPADEIERFKKHAEYNYKYYSFTGKIEEGTTVLSFNSFIPYPKKFTDLDEAAWRQNGILWAMPKLFAANVRHAAGTFGIKDGFNQGGYEWCGQNWGTKWDAGSVVIDDTDWSDLMYKFETAWAPPKPVIQKMGEMFPALEFTLTYFECGMEFNGRMVMKNGELAEDVTGKYYGHRGG